MGIKLDCTIFCTTLGCTAPAASTGLPGTAGIACGSTGGGRAGTGACTARGCCTGEGAGCSAGIRGGNLNPGERRVLVGIGWGGF